MAKVKDPYCVDVLSEQIDTLFHIEKINDTLEDWYNNRIGYLRDVFEIQIPNSIKDDVLWSEEARATVLASAYEVVEVLDKARLKPKPYEADGIGSVRRSLKKIEHTLIEDMANSIKECECPENEG